MYPKFPLAHDIFNQFKKAIQNRVVSGKDVREAIGVTNSRAIGGILESGKALDEDQASRIAAFVNSLPKTQEKPEHNGGMA